MATATRRSAAGSPAAEHPPAMRRQRLASPAPEAADGRFCGPADRFSAPGDARGTFLRAPGACGQRTEPNPEGEWPGHVHWYAAALSTEPRTGSGRPTAAPLRPQGTTNGSATWRDALHPMHRHEVGARELPIGGSSTTVAVPTRQTDQRHVRHRVPPSATVRRERAPVASQLLLVVQLRSERPLARAHVSAAPVRERRPGRALSLLVQGGREGANGWDFCRLLAKQKRADGDAPARSLVVTQRTSRSGSRS
jgi:hypothetical protein